MKKLLAISVAAALCLGIAGHAVAGNNPLAQLAVDMQAKSKTRTCTAMATTYTSCSLINQSLTIAAGIATLDVVPVVYQFVGITAIAYGLDWGSTTVMYAPVWTKCADLEITRLGATEASFALTWTTCQTPPSGANSGKATGFVRFTTYGLPGTVTVKNDDGGVPRTVDCSFNGDELHTTHNGFLNGALPGPGDLDPCTAGPTAAEATTWSGVKALYR